jgi:hypothetical protein
MELNSLQRNLNSDLDVDNFESVRPSKVTSNFKSLLKGRRSSGLEIEKELSSTVPIAGFKSVLAFKTMDTAYSSLNFSRPASQVASVYPI